MVEVLPDVENSGSGINGSAPDDHFEEARTVGDLRSVRRVNGVVLGIREHHEFCFVREQLK